MKVMMACSDSEWPDGRAGHSNKTLLLATVIDASPAASALLLTYIEVKMGSRRAMSSSVVT